ncbi:MAG: PorV/PorQ family protein [Candidatus Cloacimonetes bacterium]|nr:PorV/PorQ family protein [Candidatus Cloacimonadota bacterium]
MKSKKVFYNLGAFVSILRSPDIIRTKDEPLWQNHFKILVIVLIFLLSANLYAEKYAGEFLNLGVGVKAKSLGNAFVAIADDPTAIFWNSAGMQNSSNICIDIMHSEEFAGNLKYDTFGLIYPLGKNNRLGFLLTRIGISGIPISKLPYPDLAPSDTNQPYVEKYVSNSDYAGYFALSSKLSSKLSFGISSKIIYKDIGVTSASGLGLDIGFLFNANKKIRFGLNLRDILSTTIWWNNGTTEKVNPNIFVGVGMDFLFPILARPATLSLQTDIFFEDRDFAAQLHYKKASFDFHSGLKIKFAEFLSICCGIDRKNPTAGLTISYKKFSLNYAFHVHNELKNTHRISLGINGLQLKH